MTVTLSCQRLRALGLPKHARAKLSRHQTGVLRKRSTCVCASPGNDGSRPSGARPLESSSNVTTKAGSKGKASQRNTMDMADGEALENAVSELLYDNDAPSGDEIRDSFDESLASGSVGGSPTAPATLGSPNKPGSKSSDSSNPLNGSSKPGDLKAAPAQDLAGGASKVANTVLSAVAPAAAEAPKGDSTPTEAEKLALAVQATAQSQANAKGKGKGKGNKGQQTSAQRRSANPLGEARGRKSEYRPRSALSLARRRMLSKYLPGEWPAEIRRRAEAIPEAQFNYLLSTTVILATGIVTGVAAYAAWPYARAFMIWVFSADAVEARVLQELTFETQYLASISLVTAILLGNTFAFSFDRQRQIISEISEEIFALELLLQELFIEIREPHLRWRVIKHIKRYIDDEIQARDIDSPFRVDGAIIGLFNALLSLRENEDKNITKMIASVELLAQANSRRGALAAALLPPLHWVMIASLCVLLLTAFLLFDSDFSQPVTENRTIFAVLTAMLVTILQVLQDISAPDEGLYSVRDAMENRLTYVRWQMDNILADPAIKLSMLDKDQAEKEDDDEQEDSQEPAWMRE